MDDHDTIYTLLYRYTHGNYCNEALKQHLIQMVNTQPEDATAAIQCEDVEVRKGIFRILLSSNVTIDCDLLIEALHESDELASIDIARVVAERCVDQLAQVRDEAYSCCSSDFHTNCALVHAIRGNLEPLRKVLYDDEDENQREKAIFAIRTLLLTDAVDDILRSLDDPNDIIRFYAVYAVGEMHITPAIPSIIKCLNDSEPDVRRAAAWSLGELHAEAALQPLITLARADKIGVRLSAIDALGQIGHQSATATLIDVMYHDDEPLIRATSASAFETIVDADALVPLRHLCEADPSSMVRESACEALSLLTAHLHQSHRHHGC